MKTISEGETIRAGDKGTVIVDKITEPASGEIKATMSRVDPAVHGGEGETITVGDRTYRKFIRYPEEVTDGTLRCISCGQIDEALCPACRSGEGAGLVPIAWACLCETDAVIDGAFGSKEEAEAHREEIGADCVIPLYRHPGGDDEYSRDYWKRMHDEVRAELIATHAKFALVQKALEEIASLFDKMAGLHPTRDFREILPDPSGLATRIRLMFSASPVPEPATQPVAEWRKAIWHDAHNQAAEELPRIKSGICLQPGLAALLANFAIKHAALTQPAPAAQEAPSGVVEAAWREIIEKDDRTSPEEYPDMALITRDELAAFISRAARAEPQEGNERQIIADLFAPDQHFDGCLFKDNQNLPCQCGFQDRMIRYRKAVEAAKKIAETYDYISDQFRKEGE